MNVATLDSQSLDNLRLINTRTALESQSLESFSDTIKQVMPSIVSSMKTFFNNFTAVPHDSMGKDQPKFTRRSFDETLSLLTKEEHAKMMGLRVYTPEGFKGHLPSYVEELLLAQEHANNVVADVLTPYNTYLSKLISDKKSISDTRLHLTEFGSIMQERENIKARLGNYFQPGATNSSCKLGDVIARSGDWKQFAHNVEKLSAAFDPKKPGQVKDAVAHCTQFLDILGNYAEQDDLNNISAQNLRTLGDVTLQVAHEVEFFSLVNYQVNSLLAVMAQNTEFLKKALTD